MAVDQKLSHSFEKQVVYFMHAAPSDAFDLSITRVPNDVDGEHAKAELIFFQEKGVNKTEVVAAVRMQAFELAELYEFIGRRLRTFRESSTK